MKENLLTRNDTLLGICQGLGEDFGFNPLWLRLAFIAPLFWFPAQMVALYLGLGLVVLVSRLLFPARRDAAETGPLLVASNPADPSADADEPTEVSEAA
ncbi:PspC domain-containing protein [Sphingomicrobium lutaoense]|uniref:Phage shock protein PspC (Stress-responsive transcriptional regulator) n=1 Tax=Sphingomicrobium lutaoense TaxID=515949 RepID=A0A839Z0Y8_9SPHN|nr:PspC domain-containing protein [Sphingomicrobium lutaoense]MBB3763717.1 phage shock protein PspC (stress-responsive transcriptional regulator) [Sphingomicrobium lutaoense]